MPVVTQATLRTARIQLVPLSDDHLAAEVELDADPEVMRYLGRPRQRAEVEQAHRRRLAAATRVPGLGFWAGLVDGSFVGWWILEPPERADQGPVDGQAELGYRLLRRYWRRGLASEGARELVRHGFEELGLRRIFAETMAVNLPSRATMASVGLTYVRTFHLDFDDPLPGSEHGEVEYAITRDEWRNRRNNLAGGQPVQQRAECGPAGQLRRSGQHLSDPVGRGQPVVDRSDHRASPDLGGQQRPGADQCPLQRYDRLPGPHPAMRRLRQEVAGPVHHHPGRDQTRSQRGTVTWVGSPAVAPGRPTGPAPRCG
jgi:RimJ/RimL family protein N-acetyltransferase